MSPSFTAIISVLLPLISMVSGHMVMSNPPPIRYKDNPNSLPANVDYSYTSPLSASGSNFPCKGYNKFLDTSEGASVATWAAGSTQSLTITGSAIHGGGSCQVSFSEDGGTTFKVARSYIGNCPATGTTNTLSFTVPASAQSKKLLVAWSWFNKVGNREMYMDCAAVTITGGGSGLSSSLPDMFVANVGNGCSTVDSQNVLFPNPGADVVKDPSQGDATAPVGTCGTAGSGTGTSPIVSPAPSPAINTPVPSPPANVPATPSPAIVPTTSSSVNVAATSVSTPSSQTIKHHSGYAPSPVASTSSVPEGLPSGYTPSQSDIPACKRSVRYSVRNVPAEPIMVQPGCQCTCVNNVPKAVNCGSLL